MDIIAGLSDEKLSYIYVEITQISCFLMVAVFGPGSIGCYGIVPGPL